MCVCVRDSLFCYYKQTRSQISTASFRADINRNYSKIILRLQITSIPHKKGENPLNQRKVSYICFHGNEFMHSLIFFWLVTHHFSNGFIQFLGKSYWPMRASGPHGHSKLMVDIAIMKILRPRSWKFLCQKIPKCVMESISHASKLPIEAGQYYYPHFNRRKTEAIIVRSLPQGHRATPITITGISLLFKAWDSVKAFQLF